MRIIPLPIPLVGSDPNKLDFSQVDLAEAAVRALPQSRRPFCLVLNIEDVFVTASNRSPYVLNQEWDFPSPHTAKAWKDLKRHARWGPPTARDPSHHWCPSERGIFVGICFSDDASAAQFRLTYTGEVCR